MDILIFGGSSGIGKAFVKQLCGKNGVTAVSNDRAGLCRLKKCLAAQNISIGIEFAELTDEEQLQSVCRKYSYADMVINSAGRGRLGDITSTDYDDEYRNIMLNVVTFHYITKFFAAEMLKRKRGIIINVCSSASFVPMPNFNLYAATKAFCGSYTIAAEKECRGQGVRIMALCPGTTRTNFLTSDEFDKAEKMFSFRGAVMKPDEVVKKALKALKAGKTVCIPGVVNKFIYCFDKAVPIGVSTGIIYRLYRRINNAVGVKMLSGKGE